MAAAIRTLEGDRCIGDIEYQGSDNFRVTVSPRDDGWREGKYENDENKAAIHDADHRAQHGKQRSGGSAREMAILVVAVTHPISGPGSRFPVISFGYPIGLKIRIVLGLGLIQLANEPR